MPVLERTARTGWSAPPSKLKNDLNGAETVMICLSHPMLASRRDLEVASGRLTDRPLHHA